MLNSFEHSITGVFNTWYRFMYQVYSFSIV